MAQQTDAAPGIPVPTPPTFAPPKTPQTPKFDPPKPPEPRKIDPPGPDKPAQFELEKLEPGDVTASKTIPLDLDHIVGSSLSPDGKYLGVNATEKGQDILRDGTSSYYFDVATGKRMGMPLRMHGPGQIAAGGKSAVYMDNQLIEDSPLMRWDIAGGKSSPLGTVKIGWRNKYAVTPDGKLMVGGGTAGVAFQKLPGGAEAFPPAKTADPVLALSETFLGGTRVATVHDKGLVRVWDLTTGKEREADALDTKWTGTKPPDDLAVAEDGVAMTIADGYGGRKVCDLAAKKVMGWEQTSRLAVTTPSYRPMAGGFLYFDGRDYGAKLKGRASGSLTVVAVIDLATGKQVRRLIVPEDAGVWTRVLASADGRRVVLLAVEKARVHVWDIPDEKK